MIRFVSSMRRLDSFAFSGSLIGYICQMADKPERTWENEETGKTNTFYWIISFCDVCALDSFDLYGRCAGGRGDGDAGGVCGFE